MIWLLILLSLTAILGSALISGNILLYLAPRMVPMVWFGVIVLAGLCVYQCIEVIKCLHSAETAGKVLLGTLLFFVPVIFIITVTPNASTPGSLPNQNVRMVTLTAVSGTSAAQADAGQIKESASAEENTAAISSASTDFLPCVLEEEHAFFNTSADVFMDYLSETVEALAGRTITVYGFVYFDDTFPENTVLVSRLMITCCAADAATVGFHVQIEEETDLALNEWIRVTGTIQIKKMLYYGSYYDFPVLTDGLILRCDAPDVEDAYIYP